MQQFPTLSSAVNPDNARIGLAAGLGLVTFRDVNWPACFKAGHNDTTGNMVICQEYRKRCVLMLGASHMPVRWEYGAHAPEAKAAP